MKNHHLYSLISILFLGSLTLLDASPFAGRDEGQKSTNSPTDPASAQLSGKLIVAQGKYLITDEKTQITFEVQGPGLARYEGMIVSITGRAVVGATPVAGTTQVISVAKIGAKVKDSTVATKTGSSATKVVILGSTVAGGTIGGLYGSGAIGSDKPASRP